MADESNGIGGFWSFLFGLAAGIVGTMVVKSHPSEVAMVKRRLPSKSNEGWWVLGYEDISDRKYRGKGHLKQADGPFDEQAQADRVKRDMEAHGWTEDADARAVVEYRRTSPM